MGERTVCLNTEQARRVVEALRVTAHGYPDDTVNDEIIQIINSEPDAAKDLLCL